jgi:hypothetical protein
MSTYALISTQKCLFSELETSWLQVQEVFRPVCQLILCNVDSARVEEPDLVARIKHQLCDPFHLQAVIDEHLAANMSCRQMSEIR